MQKFALILALTLTALPVMAGGVAINMPNLTWPETTTVTGSTKGCAASATATADTRQSIAPCN